MDTSNYYKETALLGLTTIPVENLIPRENDVDANQVPDYSWTLNDLEILFPQHASDPFHLDQEVPQGSPATVNNSSSFMESGYSYTARTDSGKQINQPSSQPGFQKIEEAPKSWPMVRSSRRRHRVNTKQHSSEISPNTYEPTFTEIWESNKAQDNPSALYESNYRETTLDHQARREIDDRNYSAISGHDEEATPQTSSYTTFGY